VSKRGTEIPGRAIAGPDVSRSDVEDVVDLLGNRRSKGGEPWLRLMPAAIR
jgi:hypothetical protein